MTYLKSDLSSQSAGICLCVKPWRQNQRKVVKRTQNGTAQILSKRRKNRRNFIKSDLSTGNETLEGKTVSISPCEGNNTDKVIPQICVQPAQHSWETDDHKNSPVLDHLGIDMCSATKTVLKLSTNNNTSRRISEDKTASMHKDKDKLRPDDRLARRRKQSLSLDPQILLQWAATHNDVETLRNVLETGTSVDINQPGVDGFYALHRAASTGSFECLQYLVTKGAQLEVRDKDGSSPLDTAVYEGEFDCARFLIEKGASISHIRDGYTDAKLVKIRGRNRVMTLA